MLSGETALNLKRGVDAQAAILAVGATQKRVIMQPGGGFAESSIMSVTMSCDHRVNKLALFVQLEVHMYIDVGTRHRRGECADALATCRAYLRVVEKPRPL